MRWLLWIFAQYMLRHPINKRKKKRRENSESKINQNDSYFCVEIKNWYLFYLKLKFNLHLKKNCFFPLFIRFLVWIYFKKIKWAQNAFLFRKFYSCFAHEGFFSLHEFEFSLCLRVINNKIELIILFRGWNCEVVQLSKLQFQWIDFLARFICFFLGWFFF